MFTSGLNGVERIVLYLLIALTSLTTVTESWAPYRLPSHLSPEHYTLKVITHLEDESNFMFEGSVTIRVRCLESASNVTVHVKDPLQIEHDDVKITGPLEEDENGERIAISSHRQDSKNDFYVIELSQPLQRGMTYKVHIPFYGKLTKLLAGYYLSSYVDLATGKTRWMASTQFEPTDARRAFPCFDEPALKARFSVSLGRWAEGNLTSLSNMPLRAWEPMEDKPGWIWDHFIESVPMSTYLVAYVVSDFEHRKSKPQPNSQVNFHIWARRDAMNQVDLAADVGPRVLSFFEGYYDVPYPLPKQDMIAIPDFSSGAMENWGLITYRETTLLHDPKVSTIQSKQSVISVVAHELAHQWFGNLVTMKWWTDLWLNEGFATYAATVASDHIKPEWNLKDESAVEGYMIVTALDSLKSSHPISVPIGHPSEISQIFDTISYKKGSFILRMMNLFLGENTFRNGVSLYLKRNKFKNAEQDDLWRALTIQAHHDNTLPSDLTVKQIMDTWTLQTGYPVITVERNYENGTASVKQERFFGIKYYRDLSALWWVPLSFTSQDELNFAATTPKQWLPNDISTEVIGLPEANKWVMFNLQAAGLYRVNYDQDNWNMIIATFNSPDYKKIHVVNRAQVIDDAMSLARVGKMRYSLVFDLLNYLRHEKHYLPWRAALRNIAYIDHMMRRTGEYGIFKKFMRKLLTPVYEEITIMNIENELLSDVKQQQQIIGWSCKYDVGDCVSQAMTAFRSWRNETDPDSNNPISRNLRTVIYCTAIKYGSEDEWEFAWERYRRSNVGSEKSVLLSSLGCTKEEWLLRRYLDWSKDENSGIRRQDSYSAFVSVAGGTTGHYVAFSFLKNHHQELFDFYGPKATRLGRYFSAIGSNVNLMAEYNELKAMGAEPSFLPSKLAVDQTSEKVLNNVDWRTNYLAEITQLLKDKVKEAPEV